MPCSSTTDCGQPAGVDQMVSVRNAPLIACVVAAPPHLVARTIMNRWHFKVRVKTAGDSMTEKPIARRHHANPASIQARLRVG